MLAINIINGLVYGALLAIVASGLALIYGLRRVVNFAHGSLYMLGAYIGYTVAIHAGFWAALAAAPLAMFLIGVLLDRYGLRLLRDYDPLSVILVTFGLLLIIEDLVQTLWGKGNLSLAEPDILSHSLHIAGMTLPAYRIAVVAVGILVAIGLTFWLQKTRMGLFVRASSTDPDTTAMQGVNTDRLGAFVVGLGTALAGFAGIVTAPFLSLSPTMGSSVLIDSFMVVVIGGLGSLPGAFLAALVLGQVQTLGATYLPEISASLPFILMIAILIWRPAGIAGNRT
ncbi:branched-chain amino acid ABC transporter permease [Castellaniella denitrificans]|jgi:branched-chain amino acid transport system permease protein|uniref:branched-chain amino acid ABC transporter permease n=1 Tax=Castellaniella denitrificans TaxID=56119 RepID=UPI001AC1261C|nr:branched-chain amino acid ABC transporter permease [Burkholderiales bacterium]